MLDNSFHAVINKTLHNKQTPKQEFLIKVPLIFYDTFVAE